MGLYQYTPGLPKEYMIESQQQKKPSAGSQLLYVYAAAGKDKINK